MVKDFLEACQVIFRVETNLKSLSVGKAIYIDLVLISFRHLAKHLVVEEVDKNNTELSFTCPLLWQLLAQEAFPLIRAGDGSQR